MSNLSLVRIKDNAVSELIRNGISQNEAFIEVEILLQHVFNISKKDILLYPDKKIPLDKIKKFSDLIQERVTNKLPIQYITNKAYFMGCEFYVDKNVLIPRPETEILVEEIVKLAKVISATKIIDIGTGSGCIACMLAKYLPNVQITASDISSKALEIAKINAKNLEVQDQLIFVKSDIFSNISDSFDIIVSNPPYIPIGDKDKLQDEVVIHEPHLALFADDEKGISFYEKIIKESKAKLKKGGYIAFEIGIFQAEFVSKILKNEFYQDINIIKDYSNIERIITSRLKYFL